MSLCSLKIHNVRQICAFLVHKTWNNNNRLSNETFPSPSIYTHKNSRTFFFVFFTPLMWCVTMEVAMLAYPYTLTECYEANIALQSSRTEWTRQQALLLPPKTFPSKVRNFHSTRKFVQHTAVVVVGWIKNTHSRHHIFGCTHTAHILTRYQQHPSIAIAFAMPISLYLLSVQFLSHSLRVVLFHSSHTLHRKYLQIHSLNLT